MKKKNLGTIERVMRIGLGAALAIWALVLLFAGGGLIWILAHIALAALGADFVVTGIRGYCPLYNLLDWTTAERTTSG